MLNDFVDLIVRANLALGAAILLVLALRAPVRRLFGARVAYGLWLTPVLAVLVACFAPARMVEVTAPVLDRPAPVQEAIETSARLGVTPPPPALMEKIANLDVALIGLGVWIAGALLALLILVARQVRFLRAMGRVSPLGDNVFRAESEKAGPAVVGVLRPRIITPSDFDARFDESERDVVLAHERAHLAQRDPWINAAAALARCVAWFNPLVHVAERALRFDQELSCDAAVLGARTGARRRYAAAMLKSHAPTLTAPLGCAWPGRDFKPMKERIIMLKQALPTRTRMLIGASVVSLAVMGAAGVAWSARPTEIRVAERGAAGADETRELRMENGEYFEVLLGEDDPEAMERLLVEINETAGEEAARAFEERMHEFEAQMMAFEAQAEQFAMQFEPPEPADLADMAEPPEPPEPPEIADIDVDVRIHDGSHVRINPPSREQIERLREQAERMAEQQRRMAEQHRMSADQRREHQERARAAAEAHREQARAAAEDARAQMQTQMQALREARQRLAEQERELARARAELERDLARLEGGPVIIDRQRDVVRVHPPVRVEREERVIRRAPAAAPAPRAAPAPMQPPAPPTPSEDSE